MDHLKSVPVVGRFREVLLYTCNVDNDWSSLCVVYNVLCEYSGVGWKGIIYILLRSIWLNAKLVAPPTGCSPVSVSLEDLFEILIHFLLNQVIGVPCDALHLEVKTKITSRYLHFLGLQQSFEAQVSPHFSNVDYRHQASKYIHTSIISFNLMYLCTQIKKKICQELTN